MSIRIRNWIRACAGSVALLTFAGQGLAQELPEGPGKQAVVRICSTCHNLQMATRVRLNKQAWDGKVNEMVLLGMKASDEDIDAAVEYLATYFNRTPPKVNVNKAPAGEIETSLRLSSREAAAIVEYRQQKGAYKALSDLEKVPGLDAQKLEARKDQIVF